ncbi:uncharacterized protein LOC119694723 [Plutella xylostella]|uniref:uncharacterized protein LOC119694723 n=1 Tax=Plutella xylostella TaxID=51655 RepID=UPI002032DD23|nr:uncharacterized protein LOC119694723 [Plutella xylostella]
MQHEDPSKVAMALPIVSSQNDSNELKHHLENSYMEINNSSTRNITLYDDDEANNTEKMKQEAFLQSEVDKFLMPHKLQLLQIIHTYMRSRLRNRLLLQKIRYYHSELQKAKLLEREPYVTSESYISEKTSDVFRMIPNRFKPFEEITTEKIKDVLPRQESGSVKLPDYIYDGLELMLKRSKQVLAKYFNVTL